MKIEFKETQKFTQWWLWLLLIVIFISSIVYVIKDNYINEVAKLNLGLIIFSGVILGIIILFSVLKLITIITSDRILIHFFPFMKREIKWIEIKSAKIINYGFVGGWGIRLWTNYGTVYNAKGNIGLYLELNDGKKLTIGTQKEEELNKIVNNYFETLKK